MRQSLAVLVLLLAPLGLSACGDDSSSDPADASPGGDAASSDAADPADGAEPTAAGGEDPEPAAGPGDVCTLVSAEEMTEALGGGPLTLMTVPGSGCNFSDEADPASPSVALTQTVLDPANGGFEGTKLGITAVVKGEVEDLADVGDGAFVVVGPTLGGSVLTGGGGVLLGDAVVQVTLLAGGALDADQIRQATVDVLTLIASKA